MQCVKHGSLWPVSGQTYDHQLTHGQLADMARHYYSWVQAQGFWLDSISMPPDESRNVINDKIQGMFVVDNDA